MNLKKREIYPFTNENELYYTLSEPIDSMVMTKDTCTIITITNSGVISFFNTTTGNLERVLHRESQSVSRPDRYGKKHEILLSGDDSFLLVLNSVLEDIVRIELSTKAIKFVNKTKIFLDHDVYGSSFISSANISPNDDFFLVAFAEHIVLNNVKDCSIREKLIWKNNNVNTLAYNSKSFYFIAGSLEGNMTLYAQQPLKNLWSMENAHKGAITSLLFTDNTEKIISSGEDGEVKVWDFHTGRYLKTLYQSEKKIKTVALTEDETYLVITLEDSIVRLVMKSLEIFSKIDIKEQLEDSFILTSLVQKKIAVHTKLNGLQLYDIENGKLLKDFSKSVYSNQTLKHVRFGCAYNAFLGQPPLDISFNSRYLVTGLNTQKVALWEMQNVELLGTFGNGEKSISAVGISADNKYVFSAGFKYVDESMTEASIEMYEVESSLLVYSFEINEQYVSVICLRVTPDGRYLIALLSGAKVMKWDMESLELLESRGISCHEYDIYAPTMSWDGSLIMYALDRGTSWSKQISSIEIVDVSTGSRIEKIDYKIDWGSRKFLSIEISADNRYVRQYADNLELFCWDRVEKVFLHDSQIHCLDGDSDNVMIRSVIAPNRNYRVNIYENEKRGLSVWSLEENQELYRLLVAENDNALILDMEENEVMVDGENEVLLKKLKVLKTGVYKQMDFEYNEN